MATGRRGENERSLEKTNLTGVFEEELRFLFNTVNTNRNNKVFLRGKKNGVRSPKNGVL